MIRFKGGQAVDRSAHGVDDAPLEEVPHRNVQLLPRIADEIPRGHARHMVIGHQQNPVILEAHHLSQHLSMRVLAVNMTNIADCRLAAGCFDRHPDDIFDLPDMADGFRIIDDARHIFKHTAFLQYL